MSAVRYCTALCSCYGSNLLRKRTVATPSINSNGTRACFVRIQRPVRSLQWMRRIESSPEASLLARGPPLTLDGRPFINHVGLDAMYECDGKHRSAKLQTSRHDLTLKLYLSGEPVFGTGISLKKANSFQRP